MTKIQVENVTYQDIESEQELQGKNITAVHAFCFYKDKFVIVYSKRKGYWTPPGGGVEQGETAQEAIIREVKEETNMKVVHQQFIGYQDIVEESGVITQVRAFCIIEPYGDFVEDPDEGEITEVKLIDPKDYREYFDWGEIGAHVMKRVVEVKEKLIEK